MKNMTQAWIQINPASRNRALNHGMVMLMPRFLFKLQRMQNINNRHNKCMQIRVLYLVRSEMFDVLHRENKLTAELKAVTMSCKWKGKWPISIGDTYKFLFFSCNILVHRKSLRKWGKSWIKDEGEVLMTSFSCWKFLYKIRVWSNFDLHIALQHTRNRVPQKSSRCRPFRDEEWSLVKSLFLGRRLDQTQ